eukprot:Gb_25354 [translate_table: standard]
MPRSVVDLVDLPDYERVSADAVALTKLIKRTHEEVRSRIEQSNRRYKAAADRRRRHKEFEVGDRVMVYLRKERFSSGTYNKLKLKKIGPCRIVRKCGTNAYQVDLPDELDISSIFNISDLYAYSGGDRPEEEPVETDWRKKLPKKKKESVEKVLDQKEVVTRGRQYRKYLVKWARLPYEDSSWISEEELRTLSREGMAAFRREKFVGGPAMF